MPDKTGLPGGDGEALDQMTAGDANFGTLEKPFATEQEFQTQFKDTLTNAYLELQATQNAVMGQIGTLADQAVSGINDAQAAYSLAVQGLSGQVQQGIDQAFDAVEQQTLSEWSAAFEYASQAGAEPPTVEQAMSFSPTVSDVQAPVPPGAMPALEAQSPAAIAAPTYPSYDMGGGRRLYDAGSGCCCVDYRTIDSLASSGDVQQRAAWQSIREMGLARFGSGNYAACKKPGSDQWTIIQGDSLYNATFNCNAEEAFNDPQMGGNVNLARCSMVQIPGTTDWQFTCAAPGTEEADSYIGYRSPSDNICTTQTTRAPHCETKCDAVTQRNIETCTDRLGMQLSALDKGPCTATTQAGCCPPPVITVTCPDDSEDESDDVEEEAPECDPANPDVENLFCPPPTIAAPAIKGTPGFDIVSLWCDNKEETLTTITASAREWHKELLATVANVGLTDMASSIFEAFASGGTSAAGAFGGLLSRAVRVIEWIVNSDLDTFYCQDERAKGNSRMLQLLDVVEHMIGIKAPKFRQYHEYARNQSCPVQLPSRGDADTAYMAGEVTVDEWKCWVTARDNEPISAYRTLYAQRTRPNPAEVVSLHLRGAISDGLLAEKMRGNGILDTNDVKLFQELARFIPPYTDLTRFMVRDAFDDAVSAKYGYDEEFNDKFTGKAKQWAKAQGIDEDVFKYIWRAHWQLPSAGQAYTMLHRLRQGRVDEKIATTFEDVTKLLEINDVPEYWRERLMAVSYNVMRLVDLRNAYLRGFISHDEVVEQLQDRGYSEDDARRVGELFRGNRIEYGLARQVTKDYIAGGETRQSAIDELHRLKFDGVSLLAIIGEADRRIEVKQRKACLSAIRKRFLCGEMGVADARAILVSRGYDAQEAEPYVQGWACELSAQCKKATAAQLCQWFKDGLITRAEIVRRLVLIGWARADAERIALTCHAMQQKQMRNQQKQKDREDAAKQRAADRAKKDQEAAKRRDERAIKATGKALADGVKLSAATLVHLLRTRGKLADMLDVSDAEATQMLDEYLCQLREVKGVATEEGLDVIDALVARALAEGEDAISSRFVEALELIADIDHGDVRCSVGGKATNGAAS